jgi:nitronate monooxygenase
MSVDSLPVLRIEDLKISPPIIQGGMGVRVSRANLASAVGSQGCVGVIASVGLGRFEHLPGSEYVRVNEEALRHEIQKARRQTNGIIGVNVMVALTDYENHVRACVDENVDLIISGAGLPLDLPKLTSGTNIKLLPIVSSARAFNLICTKWKRDFDRLPDAVVVEGSEAGGHLGFKYENVVDNTVRRLEQIVTDVIAAANSFPDPIPVIAAGGIYDGSDIARFIKLGAAGVQLGTRFVCTVECDVHEDFKKAYLALEKEDIVVIRSPVGLPGRVIRNGFVERILRGEKVPFHCRYHCLKTCTPETAPYCIADVLAKAAEGDLDESFVFCGSNAYRCMEIVPVKDLIDNLVAETLDSLNLTE